MENSSNEPEVPTSPVPGTSAGTTFLSLRLMRLVDSGFPCSLAMIGPDAEGQEAAMPDPPADLNQPKRCLAGPAAELFRGLAHVARDLEPDFGVARDLLI